MHYKQINAKLRNLFKKRKEKKRMKNMSCMFRPGFLSALSVYSCCLVSWVSVWMSGAPLVCHDLLMRKPDSEVVMRVLITHDSYIVLHFQLITWEHCCLSTATLHSTKLTTNTLFFFTSNLMPEGQDAFICVCQQHLCDQEYSRKTKDRERKAAFRARMHVWACVFQCLCLSPLSVWVNCDRQCPAVSV